jgi:DNA processing protein
LPAIARAAGVKDYELCPVEWSRPNCEAGRAAGARLLVHGEPDYPQALMDMTDAPPILWAQGRHGLLNRPMSAMVGARNASSLGVRMARRLGRGPGRRVYVVVSGLARGIDTAAHEAALATGTVAVMAAGWT